MSDATEMLSRFLEANNFDCAMILDHVGTNACRVGACRDKECIDALQRDFFDDQTTVAFAAYLRGKKFPQISARGSCWVLSGILSSGLIVAMYGKSPGDIHVQIEKSKSIWNDLTNIIVQEPRE